MLDILPQLLINALITGSLYALMSAGLALNYGLLGILNFSHGHFMMLGAYLFLFFLERFQSFSLAIPVTIASSVMFSVIAFNVFIRPFTKFDMVLTLVTTLALSIILESLVSIFFGVNVKSFEANFEVYEIFNIFITSLQIGIILSAIIGLSGLGFIIHKTVLGRKIRALASNSNAAQSIAISRHRITYGIFILGTLLAVVAGILLGYETNLSPTMGGGLTIKCFSAMILGGLGNFWGAIVGSYILGLIENLVVGVDIYGYSIPAGYKDAVSFLVILIVLLFFPAGLFKKKERRS